MEVTARSRVLIVDFADRETRASIDGLSGPSLTCDKFATDVTFLSELRVQTNGTLQLIDDRQNAFTERTGTPMRPGNVWLAGRRREAAAPDAITAVDEAHSYCGCPQPWKPNGNAPAASDHAEAESPP